MTKVYGIRGSIGRASRPWWVRRIRSTLGIMGFVVALVFAFLVAMANSGQSSPVSAGPYYRRCADARAAGVVPIHRGEPGYRASLDADNDGIACEPYR